MVTVLQRKQEGTLDRPAFPGLFASKTQLVLVS